MTPPGTLGFHHVTLVSSDAERTLAFYGELLGLSPVGRTDDHLYLSTDAGRPGTILAFLERPHAERGTWGVGGVHHLALGVADEGGLLMWKRRLTDAGVRVTGPIDRGYFTSLYFADPDGQVLEIATAGPGYAVDEPADRLGERLVVPPRTRLPAGRDADAIAARTHPEPVPRVTGAMRLDGIHHVSGITDELARAHDFYTEALGLRLVKKTLNQDDGRTEHWFWARWDGAQVGAHSALTLFGWPGSDRRPRPGAGQAHRVAFRASDEQEPSAWQDHLRGMGLEVTEVLEGSFFRSIHFRAPDGLLLEIATDGPGLTGGGAASAPVSP